MAAIFAVDIFKYIFCNEKVRIVITMSPKLVSKATVNNKQALV